MNSPAMAAALDRIERECGMSAVHKRLKDRCRFVLRRGPAHPAVKARYGARAAMMWGFSTWRAVLWVERCYADELRAFEIACSYGRGTRLSVVILEEMRLILRWLRRNWPGDFRALVAEVLEGHAEVMTR